MHYELMMALVSEDAVKAIKEILAAAKVKILNEEVWGKRRLAYRIGPATEGYYLIYKVTATPGDVAEISKKFKLSKEVLRFLFTKSENR